jgi:hypothetical protein
MRTFQIYTSVLVLVLTFGCGDDPITDPMGGVGGNREVLNDAHLADATLLSDQGAGETPDVEDGSTTPIEDMSISIGSEPVIEEGLPSSIVSDFENAELGQACAELQWRYPEEGTIIPARIDGLAFQWRGATGPYRLTMLVGTQAYQWFVTNNTLTPKGTTWELVQDLAQGLAPIEIQVEYLGADNQRCASPNLTIEVAEAQLKGAVYYWSTTDSGIMRLPIGDAMAELILGSNLAADPPLNCPACHALSKDGSRMAFTNTTFPPFGTMSAVDTEAPTVQLYRSNEDRNSNNILDTGEDVNDNGTLDTVKGYFPSFAPDNRRVVAGVQGKLLVIDTDDGRTLEQLPIQEEQIAIHPDWSWQGERIVGVMAAAGLGSIFDNLPFPGIEIDTSAQGVSDGSIAIWEEVDGVWGAPSVLIEPPTGDGDNGRPTFDPSGRWVAYQVAGPDSNPDDQANANQLLYITESTVATPVPLTRANGLPEQGNNWPKWSPPTRSRYIWLAFSSLRPYGDVAAGGNPQIWITAIDTLAEPGTDPSGPAFWLPGQSPSSGNHIPYWSVYEKL